MSFANFCKMILKEVKKEKKIAVAKQIDSTDVLKNKVALITGGSGGIGMAMAESFVQNGAKVVIAGTNEEKLRTCVNRIGNDNIAYVVMNALDIDSFSRIIEKSASCFEENRIDILVNSAGVMNKNDFFNTTEEEFDMIIDINLKGTYFMCQAMGKYMIENKIKGHILNVSSSSALRPAWTPYQMSKWAIDGFTRGLADVLISSDIVVNAIGPGPTATEMLGKTENDNLFNYSPAKRMATPSEVASLATFMVSDFGNMIVGDTFYLTGGSGTVSSHS